MKSILDFLRELARNNNRDWFNAHKDEYLDVKRKIDILTSELILELSSIVPEARRLSVADCTYRIYRDTRFSPDKTPYKTHIGIFINPPYGKKGETCGYYLHIEPGQSFVCGGAVCLPSPVIKAIRQTIYDNIEEYLEIVENPDFHKLFPTIGENPLKTAPKGFPKDWKYIDYLRPRDFVIQHPLDDRFLETPDLPGRLLPYFNHIKPWLDFINSAFAE